MTGPFVVSGDEIRLEVGSRERDALRSATALLDIGGDAGGRLDYTAHPDDPKADAGYRELVGDDLDHLRQLDRGVFDDFAAGAPGSPATVEAFMRVIGEARLVLADRLGIEDDGWEAEMDIRSDPELALMAWLGSLQEAAVGVLNELL